MNIVDVIANTGGMLSLLFTIAAFIIAPLQEKLYVESLLKKTFWIKKSDLVSPTSYKLKNKPS